MVLTFSPSEPALTVAESCQVVFELTGRRCSPATIKGWIRAGVRLDDGSVLRLEATKVGGLLATSRQRIIDFLSKQQENYAARGGRRATELAAV